MPSKPTIPVICEGCGETFYTWPYKLRMGEGKVCNRACQAIRDARLTPERFWSKVDKNGPAVRPELGPCWLWTTRLNADGYAHFRFEGRTRPSHVVAYILTYGPLPDDRPWVLHKCDVRHCVRPDHLFPGAHADNMADMISKGRAATGDRNAARLYPDRKPRGDRHWTRRQPSDLKRGSRHQNAKVTEAVVTEARARYAAGGVTILELAQRAGVTKATMHRIIKRKAWAHVP